ncbi:MAG TPA: response regulator transcription factor [Egibacteraceae bacterium]|nr:response regulator transcription factor [Egibacteraceae bacterium]
MATVVVVEDDARLRAALVRGLVQLGHDVEAVDRGMPGLERTVADPPDVVVLDLGLPDVDGSEWLRMIRGVSQVPVIVATARDDEREIVRVLDLGADDYIVKPFSASQLDARVRAVLRRVAGDEHHSELRVGDLAVNVRAREARLAGRPLDLTRLEFDLLAYLAARPGEVVSRRQLLSEVWHQPWSSGERTVDVHLSWLRRKLGETAAEPRYLHTVRGVGVKLTAPA